MTSPPPTQRLVRHSASYLLGQGLFFLSRLVFYCAFTRLFTPEGYGYLNLIASALLLMVVATRLGQNDSIVRFLPEAQKRGQTRQYVASVVLPMFAIGAVAIVLLTAAVHVVASRLQLSSDLRWGLHLAVPIVGLRLGYDLTYAILRANERVGAATALHVALHWTTLLGSLALVLLWRVSIAPFYVGQLCGDLIIFALCLVYLVRRFSIHRTRIDKSLLRESLRYGLPLFVFHFAAVLLLYADRYLVLAFFNATAVGQYAAGYNLAMMVQQFLTVPVTLAVVPLYMNLWSRGEREGARDFIQSTLRWFWLAVWPCLFGLVAVKSDLVVLLATEKYVESSYVIGYILLGYVFYGGYPIYAAGLLLHKKTATMSLWMVLAVALNIVGNLILIPRFYILGAAAATGLSYLVLSVGLACSSGRHLALQLWPRQATVYLLGAFVMFLLLSQFPRAIAPDAPWARLALRVAAGVVFYSIWVLAADGELRRRVAAKIGR